MTEYLTFGILLDPGLQSFTLPYFIVLFSIGAALLVSVLAPRIRAVNLKTKFLVDKRFQVGLVVLLQLVVLSSFQAKNAQVVASGRLLKLSANPSDPIDLFRGTYQALTYPDSSLLSSEVTFHNVGTAVKDSTVYVAFKENGAFWNATDVYTTKPSVTDDTIVMKARVYSSSANRMTVHYGIEQYYFEEGKQLKLAEGATAYVHVNDDGDAILTDLISVKK